MTGQADFAAERTPVVFDANPSPGLAASVKHMINELLDHRHYQKMHKVLAVKWDKHQSLSAAMKLMQEHGVEVSEEEQASMSAMDEAAMIDALVNKMPQQSKEQFQTFFLKLQLIVSTAVRVRKGLEDGNPQLVEQALNVAEKEGVAQYILKMAIVQGGSEVSMLQKSHENWIKEMEVKMSAKLRGQDELMQAQKKLAEMKAQLAQYTGNHNDKAKKVLMSLSAGNAQAIVASTFTSWRDEMRKMRQENAIRAEYEERIEGAERRLLEYKEAQLSNVRGVLNRKAAESDQELVQECFKIMWSDVEEKKRDKEAEAEVAAIEAKLKSYANAQAENTKKVMTRMSAGSDAAILNLTYQAWVAFHNDYKKNKDTEDAVKAAEAGIQKFLKEKSANARGVLDKMSSGADSALLGTVLSTWITYFKEEKQANEFAEMMAAKQAGLSGFKDRNSDNAKATMARATKHLEEMLMLRLFNAWRLDARMSSLMGFYSKKVDVKKQQLGDVQKLFKSFADRLNTGLKDQTPRDERGEKLNMSQGKITGNKRRVSAQGLSRSDGTVSLPDIHANQRAPQQRDDQMRYEQAPPQPKEAWGTQ